MDIKAFSSLHYIGLQASALCDFSELKSVVKSELDSNTIRSPRCPTTVFEVLKVSITCFDLQKEIIVLGFKRQFSIQVLNKKFSGEMGDGKPILFPDQYFTCPDCCLSCNKRCELSIGHLKENVPHKNSLNCK